MNYKPFYNLYRKLTNKLITRERFMLDWKQVQKGMTEKQELKPCPFCGHNAFIIKDSFMPGYQIRCGNDTLVCRALPSVYCKNKKGAIEAWNKRA